jgi:DNA (cytosine-5)-methyltransferase 1
MDNISIHENEMNSKKKEIRVVELFAGVGGFRIGLESAKSMGNGYKVVWSNQWEPATKKQHASETYVLRFGEENHSNEDIAKVKVEDIPNHDLLVGGFPCQDYSVARTLSHAKGLTGKKGVLWWEIHRILKEKGDKAPKYLMLENVDRLLKSPASRRGRDFAIMLASLSDLGYAVEWRVVNAADYGMPQRRRRIFILGYKKGTRLYKSLVTTAPKEWITKDGIAANAFPVIPTDESGNFSLRGSLIELTESFNKEHPSTSPFLNGGVMFDRSVFTFNSKPDYDGKRTTLGDIILPEKEIPEEFFINSKDLPRWKYLKGGKKEKRETKDGFSYDYSEGPMVFPDPLNQPSRTIVTGEGGSTPSRFKHVIKTKSGRLRRLTPVELEKLCMFPPDHTKEQADVKRAFFMGNALVVGVINKLGKQLLKKFT